MAGGPEYLNPGNCHYQKGFLLSVKAKRQKLKAKIEKIIFRSRVKVKARVGFWVSVNPTLTITLSLTISQNLCQMLSFTFANYTKLSKVYHKNMNFGQISLEKMVIEIPNGK